MVTIELCHKIRSNWITLGYLHANLQCVYCKCHWILLFFKHFICDLKPHTCWIFHSGKTTRKIVWIKSRINVWNSKLSWQVWIHAESLGTKLQTFSQHSKLSGNVWIWSSFLTYPKNVWSLGWKCFIQKSSKFIFSKER